MRAGLLVLGIVVILAIGYVGYIAFSYDGFGSDEDEIPGDVDDGTEEESEEVVEAIEEEGMDEEEDNSSGDDVVGDVAGEEEEMEDVIDEEEEMSDEEEEEMNDEEENEEEEETEEEESLVNGKTVEERLAEALALLHQPGSEAHAWENFPDMTLSYTDYAEGTGHPENILPFEYYYTIEADVTFSLCAIERTVMICDGLLDQLVTIEDIDNGRCQVIPIFLGGDGRF